MEEGYNVKRLKFDWKNHIVIFVDFYTAWDFQMCLQSSSLRDSIRDTFDHIFYYYNDAPLNTPVIEIRQMKTR